MILATRDANANVTSITDGRDGSDNRAMAYDDLDRLVSAAAPSLWRPAATSFVYDPLDNLRLSTVGTRSCTHAYNALNRLTSISGANCPTVSYGNFRVNRNNVRPGRKYGFEWDQVSGAVTYKLVQTYSNCPGHAQTVWDLPENVAQPWELTGAIPQCGPPPAPAQAQFQYTIQACSTTQCSEKSPSLTVTVSQTEARAAGPAYYHTDALGSPVVQTDAAGQEIADSRRRYEPYGKTLSALAPADQGPGYTGHVTDVLTGFSYMQQRYYDPIAGRFLSTDPIPASPGSFNRYAYALNNPYRFIDPDGRQSVAKDRRSIKDMHPAANGNVKIYNFNIPAKHSDQLSHGMVESAYRDLEGKGRDGKEQGTVGYSTDGRYSSIEMPPVSRGEIQWSFIKDDPRLSYLSHTHGDATEWYEDYFSKNDTSAANKYNLPVFLMTGSSEFKVYAPGMKLGGRVPDGRKLGPDQAVGVLLCKSPCN